jgi:phosphoserine phosphatase
MTHTLTLVAPTGSFRVTEPLVDDLRHGADAAGLHLGNPTWLAPDEACEFVIGSLDTGSLVAGSLIMGSNVEPSNVGTDTGIAAAVAALVDVPMRRQGIDYSILPTEGRRKHLLIADMDATMVVGETLDELATVAGVGTEVAEVTAQAMAGRIDFKEALRARVATLKGLDARTIDTVIEGLELSPGAETLVATMTVHGAKTMLVSGGFTPFVDHVAEKIGFGSSQANRLEIENGVLTGAVTEPILDRDAKLTALEKLAADNRLALGDAIAVGDGANDMAMVEAAGLGAAYHGKKILREAADVKIDHGDLTALLYFQGYRQADFTWEKA